MANAGAAARGSAAERLARRVANVELRAATKAVAGVALYWLHPRLSSVACGSARVTGAHAEAATRARAGRSRKRAMRRRIEVWGTGGKTRGGDEARRQGTAAVEVRGRRRILALGSGIGRLALAPSPERERERERERGVK